MIVKRTKTEEIEISDVEVERIFFEELDKLRKDCWISEGGELMTEAVTSHRFDMVVEPEEDPDYEVMFAACRLAKALKNRI